MSPATALALMIWTRHRHSLTLFGVALLLLVPFRVLLPESMTAAPMAAVVLFGFCALVNFPVVFAFALDARLEAMESGFPPRLWHLPIQTRALVGWPMLWGGALICGTWLILAAGVLRPAGYDVALWWPGLLFAVVLTWLQALMWLPFPMPWLRVIIMIPVVSAVSIGPALLILFETQELLVCGLFAILLVLAFGLALVGVSRARHGGARRWEWPTRIKVARTRADFASSLTAQRWFEWRRCGYSFPLMVAFVSLGWLASLNTIVQFVEDAAQSKMYFFPEPLLRTFGALLLTTACLFLWPILMSASVGPELGKLPVRDRKEKMASLLATRPVTTALLVRAKVEAAALTTLAGWAIFALGFLLWLILGGKGPELLEQFDALRQRYPAGPFWTVVGLFVGGAVVLCWLNMIGGLWLGLLSRVWQTILVVVFATASIGSIAFVQWLTRSPERWGRFIELLPLLAAVALALKVLAAVWSLRALDRRRLVSRRFLAGALAGWFLVAAILWGVLAWLLPYQPQSLAGIVLGLIYLLPLTRLAVAPLALDTNRHR